MVAAAVAVVVVMIYKGTPGIRSARGGDRKKSLLKLTDHRMGLFCFEKNRQIQTQKYLVYQMSLWWEEKCKRKRRKARQTKT